MRSIIAAPRDEQARNMIIAIDGPAAAGKSTVARGVAAQLGLVFLDTGAMYRAVTLVVLERGIAPEDHDGCTLIARSLSLAFDRERRIVIDGRPGEPAIRSAEVTRAVSAVSAHPGVRAAIVPQQRAEAERRGGLVAEGRDMGTVVFPDADHKFFLVASAEERARRRARELGDLSRYDELFEDIRRRDRLDSTRADSPLVQAEDAILIDTDGLDADAVVSAVLRRVLPERRASS
jgi:cytidylate kinase